MRFQAPWHWRWRSILGLCLQCGAWWLALKWSPFFGIPLSLWVVMQIRAGYTEPLPADPSPTSESDTYNSLTSDFTTLKRYNDAQTTFSPPVTVSHHKV